MHDKHLTSQSFPNGAGCNRTEESVRAARVRSLEVVSARRAQLEANMRAEGTPETMIERLATDDMAAKLIAHEDQCVGAIMRMIGGRL